MKLLQLFCSNPNRSFYVREITRKIDEQINSVRRELANLLSIGIIKSDTKDNNRLYYEVDQDYPYFKPLAEIFGSGTMSAAPDAPSVEAEAQELKHLGKVELALLTGQITRDERSGVDALFVGDINPTQVAKYVAELEEKEGLELRYTVMTAEEFAYRQEVNDRFLSLVLASKYQVLLDKKHIITPAPAKSKKKAEKKEEE